MQINKNLFKNAKRGKRIKLSWLTKLKNSEFAASAKIIYDLSEESIKKHKHLPPSALKMLGGLIQQISNLAPTQRPHQLTKTINIAHTKRKKQLTAIRQYIKIIRTAPEAYNAEERRAARRVGEWLQDIYGTRHYDMGISKLSSKLDTMFLILDKESELMQAFIMCTHPNAIEELRESHQIVTEATLHRDVEMSERDLEPSFVKLRAEIYKHIKAIVRFIDAQMLFDIEADMMLNANYMLYNYINPKQANYKQQATKRRLARERKERQNLILSREVSNINTYNTSSLNTLS